MDTSNFGDEIKAKKFFTRLVELAEILPQGWPLRSERFYSGVVGDLFLEGKHVEKDECFGATFVNSMSRKSVAKITGNGLCGLKLNVLTVGKSGDETTFSMAKKMCKSRGMHLISRDEYNAAIRYGVGFDDCGSFHGDISCWTGIKLGTEVSSCRDGRRLTSNVYHIVSDYRDCSLNRKKHDRNPCTDRYLNCTTRPEWALEESTPEGALCANYTPLNNSQLQSH